MHNTDLKREKNQDRLKTNHSIRIYWIRVREAVFQSLFWYGMDDGTAALKAMFFQGQNNCAFTNEALMFCY